MKGGPIANSRIVSCEDDVATFMARSKDKSIKKQVPIKMSGVAFTRSWTMHILPKGFTIAVSSDHDRSWTFIGSMKSQSDRGVLELASTPLAALEYQPSDANPRSIRVRIRLSSEASQFNAQTIPPFQLG
jgi:Putative transposase